MNILTAYQYKANNEFSYKSLAAYASTIPATVTLYPNLLTIVISENAAKEVGRFIDDNGLDFHINNIEVNDDNLNDVIDSETTDADTLRQIIYRILDKKYNIMIAEHECEQDKLTTELEAIRKDRDTYRELYIRYSQKHDRIREQIRAVGTLVDSIFPKD